MAAAFGPGSLDFLSVPPQLVAPGTGSAPVAIESLPAVEVERLMRLSGVDGVWVEHDTAGRPVVVLHYTPGGVATHLPKQVASWPTRIVGGEPIRARGTQGVEGR